MASLSRSKRTFSTESRGLSLFSQSTNSSCSTEWGPGTLSGKALVAVGEAVIRGVDAVIQRRKLSIYRKQFPHSDLDTLGAVNIDEMYADVLELSR